MIRFASPEWLALVPALVLSGWVFRRLEFHRPLRVLCLALLTLLLMRPQIRQTDGGLDLWVLVDRSASAADAMAKNLAEWQDLLERAKPSGDRLHYVDYADVPVVRAEGTGSYSGNLQNTRTGLAIQFALSKMDARRAERILVLSDGFSTEPLAGLSDRLIRQKVPLDYRLAAPPGAADYAVSDLRLPPQALPGEPYLIEADITGPPHTETPYRIFRDDVALTAGTIRVGTRPGALRLTDRSATGGAHRYRIEITPQTDARSGNNSAENWIEITGGPRLLLITGFPDDPVEKVLRAQGFEVARVPDPKTLTPGDLSGAKAVVLNNVPAFQLPPDFLASLDFFVRRQGGGILMTGGKMSFGSGAYFGSPIDDLLPVSMELRTEYRKLATAMSIVMDRSGSMGAGVAGGITKMDLANEGAARAVELLGARDAISILAVDSSPHVVVPLTGLAKNRQAIMDRARRITVGGGGIYVFTGLKAAWEDLKKSPAGQRHIILLADAADAEEPGDYQPLLDEITKAGGTVSVIGLGTEADCDAGFLKDVAARGKGRIFFNADAATLPGLFEQETVAVARSAFLEDPTKLIPTAGWNELAARPLPWLADVDGYNLSYLKPDATAAAFSGDDHTAPLVAFWQRGAGRAAAVTFPLAGEFSRRTREWNAYGDFIQTLSRWLMGASLPPGIGLRARLEGAELRVDLLFDQSWEEKIARHAPEILLADGISNQAQPAVWERLNPGHYRASIPLKAGQWMRGAVGLGEYTFAFGPVGLSKNPEWAADRERLAELKNISRLSAGVERLDLGKIWEAPRRAEFRDIQAWLLLAFLAAFLTEALSTRIGGITRASR